ncbi:hypothetical protein BDV38DRAFT_234962 [Aspergillus pseudotamarii]|uniref:Secreted protein n=1 Tax=Aspergillus pseudotamarii TaxID=132259 RepID=A0A5N6T867_ASPPS|nr:uncharacterized protein BDV38DRAFT_234962 [Aspergillus pseudotamarii]KAE8142523.1 hypothetical protein BDV38DRAFT_234962 [Aspergillus pseudotamarii]
MLIHLLWLSIAAATVVIARVDPKAPLRSLSEPTAQASRSLQQYPRYNRESSRNSFLISQIQHVSIFWPLLRHSYSSIFKQQTMFISIYTPWRRN